MAQGSVTPSAGGGGGGGKMAPASSNGGGGGGGGQHCRPRCGGLGRLMRKLRRQSKLLCMATRPTTFQCQYDPLSYARNFDCSGFGTALDDDSNHFYYSFSSRFVVVGSSNH